MVLVAAKPCREKVLLGASTPLVPEVCERYGVTMLSGVIMTDSVTVLEMVAKRCTGYTWIHAESRYQIRKNAG
ncbi:MAG TPA: DUF364 domain-containing protein [Thermodesulfobacteriota bacterium]|nr:hypothetical protein [Deltaproteobacteria bacterium]HNR13738.1 DUF364 domain-containing protein [Thermodesulfobacteriota bacterium]HNU71553.1 DUF364 domain-containing protein [Thermodesulfobacteriota bacterium]